MEFKFKIQQYQTDAAAAVTDVFEGQPNSAEVTYFRDLGSDRNLGSDTGDVQLTIDLPDIDQGFQDDAVQLSIDGSIGYRNAPIALSPIQLLDNVRKVQRRNQIAESNELSHDIGAVQLDVEMETGTGKTMANTIATSSPSACPRTRRRHCT